MISTKDIIEQFKSWIKWSSVSEELQIDDVSLNLQAATPNQLIFYRLGEGKKAQELFDQRVEKGNPGLLVVTGEISSSSNKRNIISLSEEGFLPAQKMVLDILYPNKGSMKLIGVTGTNGKTTVVSLADQISNRLGHPAISAGTIGVFFNGKMIGDDFGNTTPSFVDLRKFIHRYQDRYQALFFELSSHALVQKRVFGLELDGALWTSFSQDHLDYHKTMEAYFDAKLMIVKLLAGQASLLLPAGEHELIKRITNKISNFQICSTLQERRYTKVPLFFMPDYNRNNLELALEINQQLWGNVAGFDLSTLVTPEGRFSTIELKEALVVIDYAHTSEALERVIQSIRDSFPDRIISVLFGCGGDRDRTKRPMMGEAAQKSADRVYITSDNPRSEDPQSIIDEIVGPLDLSGGTIYVEVERAKSIKRALSDLEDDGILLIAGKGHEQYQEIAGVRHDFSDFVEVEKFKNS